MGVYFYVYFCYRFWEASASSFEHLGVISGCLLGSFCAHLTNTTFSSEKLGLGGVGPPFLHHVCLLFEYVFYVAV